MSKLTNFLRRKGRPFFFWPVIGSAVLLMVVLLWPDDLSTTRQDTSTTRKAAEADLIDTVTRIRDGDTIVVGSTPIRIANLDCAERGSTAGDRATRKITSLVSGVRLRCFLEGRRSYDREIGVCSLPDGRDIGEILIAGGYCQQWPG
ncbi:MAG: thermonuclease family protein [Rhodobacteraceae bacterium]|nr:thermonuclease family protein [Paracoccaceae bacterium]